MFGKEKHKGSHAVVYTLCRHGIAPFWLLLKAFLLDRELLSYIATEKNKIERCRQNEDCMAEKA